MTTEERLEKLEWELAREKRKHRRWRAGMLLLVGSAAIGVAALPRLPIHANEVRARSFVLLDERGRTSASLEMTKDGPTLDLCDHNSTRSLSLAVGEFGPRLDLRDFHTCASLNVTKDGPSLNLFDKAGNLRANLDVGKDGPSLALSNEMGNPRAKLDVTKGGAVLDLLDENGGPIKGVSHDKADGDTVSTARKE